MSKVRIAAVVVNEFGDILAYTVQGSMSQCEENAEKHFGKDVWDKLKQLGA